MSPRLLTLFCVHGLATFALAQQSGALDATFNAGDLGHGFGDALYGAYAANVEAMAQAADGSTVLGGRFTHYDGQPHGGIVRVLPNGLVDPSFNTGTGVGTGEIFALAITTEGKVMIGGNFTSFNGVPRRNVARLNPDGSLDTSFDAGTFPGTTSWVLDMVMGDDHGVYIGGKFTEVNGVPRSRIARLRPDGAVDPTFDPGSGCTGYQNPEVRCIVRQPDGKILLGGEFFIYADEPAARIVRVNEDGSRDHSFDVGTGFISQWGGPGNPTVHAMALRGDGAVVVVGEFDHYKDAVRRRLAVIGPDGSIDPVFEPGEGLSSYATSVAVDSLDRIIYTNGGALYDTTYIGSTQFVRVLPNGDHDTTFHPYSFCDPVLLQPDGKLLGGCGGFYEWEGMARSVRRFLPDGGLDLSFLHNTGVSGNLRAVVPHPDEKLLLGGNFSMYNGEWRPRMVRTFLDGAVDNTFTCGTGEDIWFHDFAVQADGRIIGAGKGAPDVVRFMPDGSLDSSFTPTELGLSQFAHRVVLQADGQIMVAGRFDNYWTSISNSLVRLHPSGWVDQSFQIGSGAKELTHPGMVNDVVVYPSGRVLVAGRFSSFNLEPAFGLVRLMPDGSVDPGFTLGNGFAETAFMPDSLTPFEVMDIELLPNGRILVAGRFNRYQDQPVADVIRLMPDGTLDPTFDAGTGSSGVVYKVRSLADGRIVIAGDFNEFNGLPHSGLTLVHADGAPYPAFEPGSGFTGYGEDMDMVLSVAVDGDRLLCGGSFTAYDGVGRNRLAAIHLGDLVDGLASDEGTGVTALSIHPVPAADGEAFLRWELPARGTALLTIRDATGRIVHQQRINTGYTDRYRLPRLGAAGTYAVELRMEDGQCLRTRFIVQ